MNLPSLIWCFFPFPTNQLLGSLAFSLCLCLSFFSSNHSHRFARDSQENFTKTEDVSFFTTLIVESIHWTGRLKSKRSFSENKKLIRFRKVQIPQSTFFNQASGSTLLDFFNRRRVKFKNCPSRNRF